MQKIKFPQNCSECDYAKSCNTSFYGSTMCKYAEAISRECVSAMLGKNAKVIELQDWEINTILNILAERPYNEVAAIIQHIKEQIDGA